MMTGNPVLRLDNLVKRFGETTAVAGVSIDIASGELLTILGPSGCGKTTTLRMIAGFETPTSGRILLDGRDITALPPQRRGFGMVFQNYALFPHLDVFENVAFGLKGRGSPRAEIRHRVEEALALVDLAGYGGRKIQQLSGGQQQRVALARALAPEPRILLLDEPLSNLDATLRERTRAELRALVERLGITAIFVTHDQEEAFELSDRIAVLDAGLLEQIGTPETLYLRPATPFVATFLGRANFLDGRLIERAGEWLVCELPGGARWRVRAAANGAIDQPLNEDVATSSARTVAGAREPGRDRIAAAPGDLVRIMVRPEALRLLPAPAESPANLTTDPTIHPTPDSATALRADHRTDPTPDLGSDSPSDYSTPDLPPDSVITLSTDLRTASPSEPATYLPGIILERRFAGPVTVYQVRAGTAELSVLGGPADGRPGDAVRLQLAPDALPLAFHEEALFPVDPDPEEAVRV